MPLKTPPVRYDLIRLEGGLDLVTPTLSLPPGFARDAINFECSITGGYSRIQGYERYDGRPNPSDASFAQITVNFTASVAVGNTITGATSGATGVVFLVTSTTVAYTKATGSFQVGETIRVGGVAKGTITALGGLALTVKMAAQYTALAADVYRTDIGAVPGSGPVRGVASFRGSTYAWRNNAGGTALLMYKATSSGWTAVPLGQELSFSAGTSAITDGALITGAVSGATGTVARVVLQSGAWTGTAAGRLILSASTGTFQAGEKIRVGGVNRADASGAQTNITLLPNGRVETQIGTMSGSTARLYGCDTVNRAFEFDGTVYVPITTGMADDTPDHLAVHKQFLFLSFGTSIQFSSLGNAYVWSPVVGAGEIAMDDAVTGFVIQPGDQSTGALAIYSNDTTSILYGTSSADFRLITYNIGTGAKAYSGQNITQSFTFSDRGVMNMQTTLNYGNFDSAALTLNLRPFTQQRRNLVTASGVNRTKSQYRIFFSDGYGLYVTVINGKYAGAMPVQFNNPVTCMCESDDVTGTAEYSFFGSTNGYVYRLDAGPSFDGQAVRATLTLVFNAINSPRILKRYRHASLEIAGNGYAEFGFAYDLGYGSTEYTQSDFTNYETSLQASFWDAVYWDNFVWDGRTLAPSEVGVDGTAENIAVKLFSQAAYYDPFTINSVIMHYTMRRGLR